ncbi:M23 family metallopeptidase [bacterium]|nr:M23 family metallopeptidase [bacterium]
MKCKITLFLLFLPIHFIYSQSYVWPTDASQLMSSSFCEYRPGHFHAGIDIKTWGQEGYQVFAIGSGYIKRILVSPYGYGKAIYLQLYNGWTAVYGHLSGFETKLEMKIKNQQRLQMRYEQDLYFGPQDFPVQSGELIGYTGKTGTGVPHLHFEVRDEENRPFNPLQLGYRIQDTTPPMIESVALKPMEYGSHVDGDFIHKIFNRRSDDIISEFPLDVWGKVGISVSVYDQADGSPNRFSPASLRLYVNGALAFQKSYRTFRYSETGLIDLDRDLRLRKQMGQEFINLYVPPGNTLGFNSPDYSGAGVLKCWHPPFRLNHSSIPEYHIHHLSGLNHIRIEAEDYWGNISTIRFQLKVTPLSEVIRSRQQCLSVKSQEVRQCVLTKTWMNNFVRFAFKTKNAINAFPRLLVWLNGKIHTSIPMHFNGSGEFVSVLPLDLSFQGEMVCQVKVETQSVPVLQDTTQVFYADQNGGIIWSRDRRFRCTIPPNTLSEPVWLCVDTQKKSTGHYSTYSIFPNDIFIKRQIKIQIAIPKGSNLFRGVGIYAGDDGESCYISSKLDKNRGILSANTRLLNGFTVLQDTMNPVLYFINPDSGQIVSGDHFKVWFKFNDSLSGISGEENYQIQIDGNPQIVEYDPEEKSARVDSFDRLEPGIHWLDILIRDRADNFIRRHYPFYIMQ